jgi:hypothetical protein
MLNLFYVTEHLSSRKSERYVCLEQRLCRGSSGALRCQEDFHDLNPFR